MCGDGKHNAKIFIVGEAAGWNEDQEGIPFVGRSGKFLMDIMLDLEYPRQKLFITNAVRCRPPDNRTPTTKEIRVCNKYLHEELDIVRPKMIIPLGNTALRAVLKKSGITKYNGKMFKYEGDGWSCDVVPAIHPAACGRNPSYIEPMVHALTRAVHQVDGKIERERIKYKLIKDIPALKKMIKAIKKKGRTAFDTETEGLHWWQKEKNLVCIGFSFKKNTGYVVPVHHDESPFTGAQQKKVLRLLKRHIFENKNIKKIAHNLKFDMLWLRRYGINIEGQIYDTIIGHYLQDENRRHGLDDISLSITNYGDYWKYVHDHGINNGKAASINLNKLGRYCAIDCDVAYRLYVKQNKWFKKNPELQKVMNYLMLPAIRSFADIEWNGMLIDVKYLKKLEKRFDRAINTQVEMLMRIKKCQAFQEVMRKEKDDPDFVLNFNSHDQVRDLMFLHPLGFKFKVKDEYKDRKTGTISTGAETLIDLTTKKRSGVFASVLLEYRKLCKLQSTYVRGMWKWLDENNYIHSTFNLIGTVTGRPSCKEPNIQNIPRKDQGDFDTPLKQYIKRLFIAPEGYVLMEGDQSQLELRIMASMSGDVSMIDAFKKGQDIHASTAARVNNKKIEDVTEDERFSSKAINFGTIYLIGIIALARKLSRPKIGLYFTEKQAQKFTNQYFVVYPAIKQFIYELKQQAQANGYVETLFGRKRRLPDIESNTKGVRGHAERQAVNAPIQGTGVDCTTLMMNLLNGYLGKKRHIPDGVLMVNMVHDSTLYYVPKNLKSKMGRLLKHSGENLPTKRYFEFKLHVPLIMDISAGRHWKKLKGMAA